MFAFNRRVARAFGGKNVEAFFSFFFLLFTRSGVNARVDEGTVQLGLVSTPIYQT
jgi:hypothetical protein